MTPETLFDLRGKTALVTGGATGIGYMAAHGLVAAGAHVLIASRNADACQKAAEQLNQLGLPGQAEGLGGDVSTEAGVAALVKAVSTHVDRLHILMNNAGCTWGAPLGQFPFQAWDKVMSLNVAGLFQLTQALLPLLKEAASHADPARVINVGSVMGDQPMGHGAYSYSASKAAVHHLTEILSNELAAHAITVNALAPGPFVSNMTAFAIGKEEKASAVGENVPLGRVGRPEDIAGTMQYLCGQAGSYVTGAIIPLSGGINSAAPGNIFDAG